MSKKHPQTADELNALVQKKQAAFDAQQQRRLARAGAKASTPKVQQKLARAADKFKTSLGRFTSKAGARIQSASGLPVLGPASNVLYANVGPTAPGYAPLPAGDTGAPVGPSPITGSAYSGGGGGGAGWETDDQLPGVAPDAGQHAGVLTTRNLVIAGGVAAAGIVLVLILRRR